jgi:hypothetical protein
MSMVPTSHEHMMFKEGEEVEKYRQAALGLPILICALGFIPVLVGSEYLGQPLTIAIIVIAWSFFALAVYLTAYRPMRCLANEQRTSITRLLIDGLSNTKQDSSGR